MERLRLPKPANYPDWSNCRIFGEPFIITPARATDNNTLSEMAGAAQELGLEYLGIADHSKSSFQAHGLDETRLLKQVEQIRQLNKGFENRFSGFLRC